MRSRPKQPDEPRSLPDGGDSLLARGPRRTEQPAPLVERTARLPLKRVAVFGATSAIAQAWMRLLAPAGTSFFIAARNKGHLEAVAKDLATRGAKLVVIEVADLDDTASHEGMLERAAASLGGMDGALIAHGVMGEQLAGEADFAVAAASLQTNFLSAASLVTWLANYFSTQSGGTIAVISSVAGDRGRKSNYVYGSAKAGLNAFLDGVRNRVDREGVQVLTIRPGFVATPMTAHLPQGPLFATPETVARDIQKAIEGRRDVLYTPWFWRWIMAAIRAVPEWKFKRMDL